jgi:hypothetical protein
MSLREISAWIMAGVMIVIGVGYLMTYLAAYRTLGGAIPPPAQFVSYAALALTAIIVVEVALAIVAPKAADQQPDERERPQLWRAGHWAGLVQGGLCIAALLYVARNGGAANLFHMVAAGLIISQIAEYVLQIAFLRRSA